MKILNKAVAVTICATMGLALTACGKNYDGKYVATYDCAEIFAQSTGTDIDFEGSMVVDFVLELEDGEYEIDIDPDKFEESLEGFVTENIDVILQYFMGTDDPEELEEYATYLGYSNYDELAEAFVDEFMSEVDIDDFSLDETGKFVVFGSEIKFDSDSGDDFVGDIKDGEITIEMEGDEDLFGSDTVELVFEAVDD